MKCKIIGFILVLILSITSRMAQAELTVIGTATYQGTAYNLILDGDNNRNSVVWLDYSNAPASWENQKAWAVGLHAQLTYNIDPAYIVTWDEAAWRLPSTVDGPSLYSCNGTETLSDATRGHYFTTSEMGHLFYTEFDKPGRNHLSGGECVPNPDWISTSAVDIQDTEPFQNLYATWYLSGTAYAATDPPPPGGLSFWGFSFWNGYQREGNYGPFSGDGRGLALRNGHVDNASIPTLSEWGQILLVMLLGLSALWVHRRRSTI